MEHMGQNELVEQLTLSLAGKISGDSKTLYVEIDNLKERLDQQRSWIKDLFAATEEQGKIIPQNLAQITEKVSSLQIETLERWNKETKDIAEALEKLTSKLSELESQVVQIKAEARGKKDHTTTIIAVLGAAIGAATFIEMLLRQGG